MNVRLISTCAAALALAFLSPVSAGTGITQDGSISWIRTNAPGTYNASASDKLVVVISGEHNFAGNLTGKCNGVTYNGQSLMQAVQQLPSDPDLGGHGQTYSSIWYLDNPGNYSGTGTIVVNCTGTSWVATAIGLSDTLPGVGSTAKISGTASLGITEIPLVNKGEVIYIRWPTTIPLICMTSLG
jgi:hypothetical protein